MRGNLNVLFLPDLNSLDLFNGQPVPWSIINPGGRRTGMADDPLRDLDGAAWIQVFGNASHATAPSSRVQAGVTQGTLR